MLYIYLGVCSRHQSIASAYIGNKLSAFAAYRQLYICNTLVDGSEHDEKSPAIKATATRINDLHAKYRAKKPEAGQLVISKDKFSKYNTKVFLWEFWEVFFCISKQVPDGHPAEAILRAFLTRFEETTAPITSIENCILRKPSYAWGQASRGYVNHSWKMLVKHM